MTNSQRDQELLAINQAMLESVVQGDWATYASYCRDDLSCFEAETEGQLVEGLPFHRFYFDLPANQSNAPTPAVTVTMARPHLRWLSDDAAVLSYVRLTQKLVDGAPITSRCCETRLWQKDSHGWRQAHVHRS